MVPEPGATGTSRLTELVQEQLAVAEANERKALAKIETAKGELATAKAEVKRHRTMLTYCSGTPGATSLSKQTVRPIIEKLLKHDGPLPEKELLAKLEVALKANSLPLTGLSLVLRPLRSEFIGPDGSWSLPVSETTPNGSPTAAKPVAPTQKP